MSILIFWFVVLKLYSRIRKLEQMITQLIRKDTLSEKQLFNANDSYGSKP
ncbi:MAG: DUF2304 family protein [Flavisolibacter sp.]